MARSHVGQCIVSLFRFRFAVGTLESRRLSALHSEMCAQRSIVLVAEETLRANVIPRVLNVHLAPLLDRERRVH